MVNDMARAVKMTFTLDEATAARINRTALRLGMRMLSSLLFVTPGSGVDDALRRTGPIVLDSRE
jgi:hypothetical protein